MSFILAAEGCLFLVSRPEATLFLNSLCQSTNICLKVSFKGTTLKSWPHLGSGPQFCNYKFFLVIIFTILSYHICIYPSSANSVSLQSVSVVTWNAAVVILKTLTNELLGRQEKN